MAMQTEPRGGFNFGWNYGENGWNSGMDANFLHLGRFGFHLSIKDRDLTAPPASPAAGDTYIPAAGATGAWAGLDGRVVVWVPGSPAGAWVSATPRLGWVAYVEDEEKLTAYKAGGWSAGVAI